MGSMASRPRYFFFVLCATIPSLVFLGLSSDFDFGRVYQEQHHGRIPPRPPNELEQEYSKVIASDETSNRNTAIPDVMMHHPEPEFCNYCTPSDEVCKRYGHFNLARSRAYEGPNASLKRILRQAQSTPTQPLKIGIIGGSVSRGHGVTPEANWAAIYADYLRDTYHIAVELINGSVGATVSEYMETCFQEHIPEDVDLVVIELAINDRRMEGLAKSYENLIRALRALPKKPAIINLQIMALMFSTITMGGDLHMAIAQYYDTPVISMRNVLLPQILQTTELNSTDTSFEDYWFNHDSDGIDLRHLGTNGHRMLADLLKSFTSRVACDAWREMHFDWNGVESWVPTINEGLLPTDKDEVKEYLPRQSLFQQYDHTTVLKPAKPFCRLAGLGGPGDSEQHILQPLPHPLSTEGQDAFELWSHPANPGKIWLTGWKPGVKVAFKVWASTLGRVRVSYLKSKTYGLGSLFCWVDGDEVGGKRMDGWWDVENMHAPATTTIGENLAPGEHILHCKILEETKDPGGGTEFRIISVDAL